jgi:hypothetical protein
MGHTTILFRMDLHEWPLYCCTSTMTLHWSEERQHSQKYVTIMSPSADSHCRHDVCQHFQGQSTFECLHRRLHTGNLKTVILLLCHPAQKEQLQ